MGGSADVMEAEVTSNCGVHTLLSTRNPKATAELMHGFLNDPLGLVDRSIERVVNHLTDLHDIRRELLELEMRDILFIKYCNTPCYKYKVEI